jgi:selenocysteine lyase/cysteine desulfurase
MTTPDARALRQRWDEAWDTDNYADRRAAGDALLAALEQAEEQLGCVKACWHQEAFQRESALKAERDEARRLAEQMRGILHRRDGVRSPLPWEAKL